MDCCICDINLRIHSKLAGNGKAFYENVFSTFDVRWFKNLNSSSSRSYLVQLNWLCSTLFMPEEGYLCHRTVFYDNYCNVYVLFTSCWKWISKYSLCCLNIALFDYVLIHTPLSLNQEKSSYNTSLHGFIFISGVQDGHATKFYDVVFTFKATKYMKTSQTYLP